MAMAKPAARRPRMPSRPATQRRPGRGVRPSGVTCAMPRGEARHRLAEGGLVGAAREPCHEGVVPGPDLPLGQREEVGSAASGRLDSGCTSSPPRAHSCGRARACRRRRRGAAGSRVTASISAMSAASRSSAATARLAARWSRLRAPTMTAATCEGGRGSRRWRRSRRRCRAGPPRGAAPRGQRWKASQPPTSSMTSLYLVSERFSSGSVGSARAEPAVRQEATCDRCRSTAAGRRPARRRRPSRPSGRASSTEYCTCIARSGTPASTSAGGTLGIEVGAAKIADLAGLAQFRRASPQPRTSAARRSPTSGTGRGRVGRSADARATGRSPPRRPVWPSVASASRSGTNLVWTRMRPAAAATHA